MAFAFDIFAKELGDIGKRAGARIMQRWEMKELDKMWKEREAIKRQGDKEAFAERTRLTKEANLEIFQRKQELTSWADRFGGNPMIAKKYFDDLTSMKPERQLKASATAGLFAKVGRGEQLSESDFGIMDAFDIFTQNEIAVGNLENKRYDEQTALKRDAIEAQKINRDLINERRLQVIDEENRQLFNAGSRRRKERYDDSMKSVSTARNKWIESSKDLQDEIIKKEITPTKLEESVRKHQPGMKDEDIPFGMYDSKGTITPTARRELLRQFPSLKPFFRAVGDDFSDFQRKEEQHSAFVDRIGATLGEPTGGSKELTTIEDVQPEEAEKWEPQVRKATGRQRKQIERLEASKAGATEVSAEPKKTLKKGQTWRDPESGKVYKVGGVYKFAGKKYRCTGIDQFEEIVRK